LSLAQAWDVFEFPPGVDPAGLRRRWLARLLDLLVLSPVIVAAAVIGAHVPLTVAKAVVAPLLYLSWGAYEVGMTSRSGATLGKRWCHIHIARMVDLNPPTVRYAILRWALLLVSAFSLPRLLLMAFSSSSDGEGRQRSWADVPAGTVVLRNAVE
jgi:uncharacterized RDD family membrane protein YckC